MCRFFPLVDSLCLPIPGRRSRIGLRRPRRRGLCRFTAPEAANFCGLEISRQARTAGADAVPPLDRRGAFFERRGLLRCCGGVISWFPREQAEFQVSKGRSLFIYRVRARSSFNSIAVHELKICCGYNSMMETKLLRLCLWGHGFKPVLGSFAQSLSVVWST